jgi:formylglycine-generating enzyme required for sulfatase activity
MHGNVRNWCADWYAEDYYVVSPTVDPHGPASGTDRVVLGSAFHYRPDFLRSATRFRDPPAHRHGQIGFRVEREAR